MNFRFLYEKILDYKGECLFEEVLLIWIKDNPHLQSWVTNISKVKHSEVKEKISEEDSWELYALSRVLDTLTLKFQTLENNNPNNWDGPKISLKEYIKFAELIGLGIPAIEKYTPLYHEIFEAKKGTSDIEISETLFPPLVLGELLIKRGGVNILCNPDKYNLHLLNNSDIYWVYRRKNRSSHDLSNGWGSNSQWRTSFRFDYNSDEKYHFNVRGKINLNQPGNEDLKNIKLDNFTLPEAIEITINRHFISTQKDDTDLNPYSFRYSCDHKDINQVS